MNALVVAVLTSSKMDELKKENRNIIVKIAVLTEQ